MRISSDVSHIVVDADARVGVCVCVCGVCVCASGGLEGSHTSNQPFAPKILADVHTISVGMRELFVDSVTNEKRDGKHLRLIGTGSSMTWRHVVEMMLTRPASLSGMPIIGLSGHTVRRFIQRACSMTEKLYRHLSKACNNAKSSEQLDLEVELNNIREGSPEHIYHLCDDRYLSAELRVIVSM